MDVDYNSQSEEEFEYMYSDEDESEGSGDDEMEEGSLENEADGEDDDRDVKKPPKESRANKKRKSTGRHSSLGGVHDHVMRDNESGIRMMDSKDLVPDMKQRIQDISEILNIPPSAACPILRSHKWAKERLFESYSSENDKYLEIQKEAGVLARCQESQTQSQTQSQPLNQTHKSAKCGICFDDDFKPSEMLAMPCGHEFCTDCWKCFIQSKIDDGPSCILATCPEFGCDEIITEEEVLKAAPLSLEKFESYQLRNFVEVNGTSRWCPGPGCERIAALQSCSGIFCDSDNIIANCDSCLIKFCIKCGDEPHQPLNCRALESWKEKCKNESETANWILANTKPCPNCRSRIEKNQGCNHMNCQKCKHEFCWICNGDWKDHGANTGGYYNCNKYNELKDSVVDKSDAAMAKRELDRYLHYYSRYHAHAEAQKFAKRQLLDTEKRMVQLQESTGNSTWTDVEFLKKANEQLVECRRVLKFTYTFAYYLTTPPKSSAPENDEKILSKKDAKDKKPNKKNNEDETDDDNKESKVDEPKTTQQMQKDRFEYHQEMLERFTENLSEMAEKPLNEINRESIVNQTRVVDNFMKNMLKYVDDGMEETV